MIGTAAIDHYAATHSAFPRVTPVLLLLTLLLLFADSLLACPIYCRPGKQILDGISFKAAPGQVRW